MTDVTVVIVVVFVVPVFYIEYYCVLLLWSRSVMHRKTETLFF